MSTSRRRFLKQTIGSTGAAWQALRPKATRAGDPANSSLESSDRQVAAPASGAAAEAPVFTRGVGVYPGDPREYFGPTLISGGAAYRNLALHRPAYHSSAYDYNLTAQLVTDGIKETTLPQWVATSSSQHGVLKKRQREWLLDHNPVTALDFSGPSGWVQVEFHGGESAPEIDRVEVFALVFNGAAQPQGLTFVASGSDDGQSWKELGRATNIAPATGLSLPPGYGRPQNTFKPAIPFAQPSQNRFHRVEFEAASGALWRVGEVEFYNKNERVEVGGPYHFTSAWMSEGQGEEWVYVDLGAPSTFDRVALYWIRRAAKGSIQVSDDAASWKDVHPLPTTTELTDDIKLHTLAHARYVRVLMMRPASPEGYVLSEMEVYGRGGSVPELKPRRATARSHWLELAGFQWTLQRSSLVTTGGEAISRVGFKDNDWMPATVPGTVLTSYFNAGALPDPNFGDNQLMISDSFFYDDFWYRVVFDGRRPLVGQHVWLNFDGINWKADVLLNGEKLGRIEGGFTRARFEVTNLLRGVANVLAVRVERNATPGSIKEKTFDNPDKNGGALGADNPTYHASIGWDWIPTIRGRNTGIWGDVYLTASGPVTIENPLVTTALPLPDTSHADISIEAELVNHDSQPKTGTLMVFFGESGFEHPVSLDASGKKKILLDSSTHPELRLDKPKLWWPTGYGEANLYQVELRLRLADNVISDQKSFQAGVRQMAFSEEGGALKIWINGRRFVPRGGNWGFSESMLRYRKREYDAAVRYHRDMNFTMIRNWVGQIGGNEFHEACDRHGIMVWQDFWLANPWDGPDPDDNEMFLRNVRDTVLRIRNHPSIGLYVGRNEGYPPQPLEDGIRKILAELHPDLHYIPSSADDVVSGHGPYQAMPPKFYFTQRATPKLHSELGMPNIVSMDSLRAMMPESQMWPQGRMWGLHDFCLHGAQGGASFREIIQHSYGGAENVADWVELAQFVNYEGYRAMFEAQSRHRMGLLIWMSHPCWPSFVWQTYDYFFEPTAAYFGCKKASEPLHIQWNPASDVIEVVNYSAGNVPGLTAQVEIFNMDGAVKWARTASLDSAEDSCVTPIKMEYPPDLTAVHFLRLKLTRGSDLFSENLYWRGTEEGNYRAIRNIPRATVNIAGSFERHRDRWESSVELNNESPNPALMVRLKVVRRKSGDRILPALFSDNYVALMPKEHRTINIEVNAADCRGEAPKVAVEGFNVGPIPPAGSA